MGRWPLPGDAFRTYLDTWAPKDSAPDGPGLMYEMTATYLHTPGAACRVKALLPDAKFVVVLRDPATRALSHWNMQMDRFKTGEINLRPLPFLSAVEGEIHKLRKFRCSFDEGRAGPDFNRCFGCLYTTLDSGAKVSTCQARGIMLSPKSKADTPCRPRLNAFMYVAYGIYAAPIAWWLNFFTPDRFLFLVDEEVQSDPVGAANRVAEHVGIEPSFTKELLDAHRDELDENRYEHTLASNDPEAVQGLQVLREFYTPQVQELYLLFDELGVDFPGFEAWPRDAMEGSGQ